MQEYHEKQTCVTCRPLTGDPAAWPAAVKSCFATAQSDRTSRVCSSRSSDPEDCVNEVSDSDQLGTAPEELLPATTEKFASAFRTT
jgi:hypothetical protein